MHHAVHRGGVDLLRLHERDPQRYPFLIESVAGHPRAGRWSILFADPGAALVGNADGVRFNSQSASSKDFFGELDRWFERERRAHVSTDRMARLSPELPFCGGWFLLLGYEAARWVEPGLSLPASPHRLPDALAVRCHAAVLHDREQDCIHLLAEQGEAQLRILSADLLAAIGTLGSSDCEAAHACSAPTIIESDPERFLAGTRRILDYLQAGDVFQVNLSRHWDVDCAKPPVTADIYRQLRRSNPAPFAGLAIWENSAVISSSPERLLQIDADRCAQTRPIAGTRPRGEDADSDAALREQLIGNLKERAEHVMLIDLERNDLGRVCMPGSVQADEIMALESYTHVHHIVSNVRGQLRGDVGPGAALRAVYPGGTITGCPKVRAMEIIAELEGEGRGPYTGSIGYLSLDGRMDSNILIRSLVLEGRRLRLRAGAGIVADSEPLRELDETRAKARGLLRAFGDRS